MLVEWSVGNEADQKSQQVQNLLMDECGRARKTGTKGDPDPQMRGSSKGMDRGTAYHSGKMGDRLKFTVVLYQAGGSHWT